ncbi:MAG: thioesterase family protein [Pseudomonadota bacterium]
MTSTIPGFDLAAFPGQETVTMRYGDTDRQGHINNAVFVTLLEAGRVSLLYHEQDPLSPAGTQFVLANLNLDYLRELDWRSPVQVGTGVLKLGNSSVHFAQMLVQNGEVAARARTVTVLMDDNTRRSTPLPSASRTKLEALMLTV